MTISEIETIDLGQLAVVVESFVPADGEYTVEVTTYEDEMIDCAGAQSAAFTVAGQRVAMVVGATSSIGDELAAHVQEALGVDPDEDSSWQPAAGLSVVAISRAGAIEAVVGCGLVAATAHAPEAAADHVDEGSGLLSLGMLRDVPLEVHAELGRTQLPVAEILQLSVGSIIELDRTVGSPVDVVVNGSLIGRGEVVVIDDEFGIRITEILARGTDTL